MDSPGEGRVSEWNEATLKVVRLHEIQGTINLLKMDPLGMTDGKFNYVWLANNVDALYGEGYSKYSRGEREKVDKIRKMVFECLKYFPPHEESVEESLAGEKKTFNLNKKNFDMLMELIEAFVREVKDANDKHGLTTKNRTTEGLF